MNTLNDIKKDIEKADEYLEDVHYYERCVDIQFDVPKEKLIKACLYISDKYKYRACVVQAGAVYTKTMRIELPDNEAATRLYYDIRGIL
jgi:hypothetical protein